MRYDALIFDNDGVLTTPTRREALHRAMYTAFGSVGATSPTEEHVETLVQPDIPSLRSIAAEYGVKAPDLWRARERAAIDAQLGELRAGRKRLYDDVATLEDLAVPQAIVSNNQHETIGNILDHFGLDAFDPWFGREPTLQGIERKKPTPYYLERALETLDADRPLYVGDSRVDVAAADACGIDCAFVRRDHRIDYELPAAPTHEIAALDALAELV